MQKEGWLCPGSRKDWQGHLHGFSPSSLLPMKRGLEQDVLGVPPTSHVAETQTEARRGAGSQMLLVHSWGRAVKGLETGGELDFQGKSEKQQKSDGKKKKIRQ